MKCKVSSKKPNLDYLDPWITLKLLIQSCVAKICKCNQHKFGCLCQSVNRRTDSFPLAMSFKYLNPICCLLYSVAGISMETHTSSFKSPCEWWSFRQVYISIPSSMVYKHIIFSALFRGVVKTGRNSNYSSLAVLQTDSVLITVYCLNLPFNFYSPRVRHSISGWEFVHAPHLAVTL